MQDAPQPQSQLMWILTSLGLYGLLIPLAALLAFVVVLILILRGKGPAVVGAILLIVPLPIYVAIYGTFAGMTASFAVIGMSDIDVKQSELLGGFAESLLLIQAAMLFTLPVFLLATIGFVVRALKRKPPTSQPAPVATVLA